MPLPSVRAELQEPALASACGPRTGPRQTGVPGLAQSRAGRRRLREVVGRLLLGGKAQERIARARLTPGFAGFPDCFTVHPYVIDQDEWVSGFSLLDLDGNVLPGVHDTPPRDSH